MVTYLKINYILPMDEIKQSYYNYNKSCVITFFLFTKKNCLPNTNLKNYVFYLSEVCFLSSFSQNDCV